jgi:hypothetical protein
LHRPLAARGSHDSRPGLAPSRERTTAAGTGGVPPYDQIVDRLPGTQHHRHGQRVPQALASEARWAACS